MELIKKLLALLGIHFPAPSVEGAIAVLNKAVKGLEAVQAHHDELTAIHNAAIQAAVVARGVAMVEADKAKTIAKNIKALFGE